VYPCVVMGENESSSESPKSTPAPEKKSRWGSFVSFVHGAVSSIEESHNEVKSLEVREEKYRKVKNQKSGPPYKHCDDYAWATQVVKFSNLELLISFLIMVMVWLFVWAAHSRPVYAVRAAGSLDQQMENFREFGSLDFDATYAWLASLLQNSNLMSQMSSQHYGYYARQMTPKIYQNFITQYERNIDDIRRGGLLMTTQITGVSRVYVNEETGRETWYLKGFTVRSAGNAGAKSKSGRTFLPVTSVPYRAEAVVRKEPPSQLNPTGLYLEMLTQKVGDDALEWFTEMGIPADPKPSEIVVDDPTAQASSEKEQKRTD